MLRPQVWKKVRARAPVIGLAALLLAGCQTVPSTLPVAEPRPAAACSWPLEEQAPRALLGDAVAALEAEGLLIRHTDLALGLVSVADHEALRLQGRHRIADRKSTRLNSSHVRISYAVFCLKKKKTDAGQH